MSNRRKPKVKKFKENGRQGSYEDDGDEKDLPADVDDWESRYGLLLREGALDNIDNAAGDEPVAPIPHRTPTS